MRSGPRAATEGLRRHRSTAVRKDRSSGWRRERVCTDPFPELGLGRCMARICSGRKAEFGAASNCCPNFANSASKLGPRFQPSRKLGHRHTGLPRHSRPRPRRSAPSSTTVEIGFGAATAFYLAKRNAGTVVLIDRHQIGSQTSPRAAGMVSCMRKSELMTRLIKVAAAAIPRFTEETGQPLDWVRSGQPSQTLAAGHCRRDEAVGHVTGAGTRYATTAIARMLAA